MPKRMFEPCIPTRGNKVPAGPDWIHEIKHAPAPIKPKALPQLEHKENVGELFEPLWNKDMDPLKTALISVGFLAAIEPAIDPSIGPVCQPREMCAPLPITLGDEPAPTMPATLLSDSKSTSGTLSTVNLSARTMIKMSARASVQVT
jgi:hypothetical protein